MTFFVTCLTQMDHSRYGPLRHLFSPMRGRRSGRSRSAALSWAAHAACMRQTSAYANPENPLYMSADLSIAKPSTSLPLKLKLM